MALTWISSQERAEDNATLAMLDTPEYLALTDGQKGKVRDDALWILRDRGTRRTRRFAVGYCILAAGLVFALFALQQLDSLTHDEEARRIHGNTVAAYNYCRFVNEKVIDPFRAGIEELTRPTSTRGITDAATLARVTQSNVGKARARASIEDRVKDANCGARP